jgi:hypothetical protein
VSASAVLRFEPKTHLVSGSGASAAARRPDYINTSMLCITDPDLDRVADERQILPNINSAIPNDAKRIIDATIHHSSRVTSCPFLVYGDGESPPLLRKVLRHV